MYIGFRWNESILPPPIADWSPKLTAGSRSSNLKSPWDGEINTRPHGAHAKNCQSLCSLPATQQKTARANPRHEWDSTLLKSWIYNHNARHSLVWWVVALGHRWKQVLRFLFHIASLWIQWKQNETNIFHDIYIKSVYYISIYLSICHMSNTFEARAKSHPSERKVPKKLGILHELLVHSQWISGSPLLHRTNLLSSICNHVVLDSETFQVEKPKVF